MKVYIGLSGPFWDAADVKMVALDRQKLIDAFMEKHPGEWKFLKSCEDYWERTLGDDGYYFQIEEHEVIE